MKINRKLVRRIKRIFKPYNLLIIACIVIVAVSVYILVKPDGSDTSSDKAEVKNTTVSKVENQSGNTTTSNAENKNTTTTTTTEEKKENTSNKKEITEKKARSIAKKKFKELGEKNLDEKSFTVYKRTREGQTHYYVRSAENTAEIDIYTGKITRLNSAVVNE